jgi:O-antigen ligase
VSELDPGQRKGLEAWVVRTVGALTAGALALRYLSDLEPFPLVLAAVSLLAWRGGRAELRVAGVSMATAAVVALWLWQAVLWFRPQDRALSPQPLVLAASNIGLFLIARASRREPDLLRALLRWQTLLAFLVAVVSVVGAGWQIRQAQAAGIADLQAVKHLILFPFRRVPAAQWATVYLALFPFPIMVALSARFAPPWRSWAVLTAMAMTSAVLLTFARGVYLGLATLVVVTVLLALRSSVAPRSWRPLVIVLALAFVPLAPFLGGSLRQPVSSTVRAFETRSQVRSFDGRKRVWRESFSLVREAPLVGHGAGSFPALHAVRAKDAPFVARPFNLWLGLAIEHGAVAVLLFAGFCAAVLVPLVRKGREGEERTVAILAGAACAGLLVRDLSYSSVLVDGAVSSGFFLLAGLCAGQQESLGVAGPRRAFAWVLAGSAALAATLWIGDGLARLTLSQAVALGRAGRWEESRAKIERSWFVTLRSAEASRLEALCWVRSLERDGTEARLAAGEKAHLEALRLAPVDEALWHNLAWIRRQRGDGPGAATAIAAAVRAQPQEAVYQVSRGWLLEASSPAEAQAAYAQALALAPRIIESRFFADLRARTPELAEGALREATAAVRRRALRSGNPLDTAALSGLSWFLGEKAEAARLATAALADLPNLPRPHLVLARHLSTAGHLDQARALLRRQIFLDPSSSEGWRALAELEAARDPAAALAAFDRAAALAAAAQTAHAQHVALFSSPDLVIENDLAPAALLAHVEPSADLPGICARAGLLLQTPVPSCARVTAAPLGPLGWRTP